MLAVIGLVILTLGGLIYALWIYRYPMRPTWLSVAMGVAGTLGGASLVIVEYSPGSWLVPVGILWGSFVLTGIPMVAGQIAKDKEQRQEAIKAARDTGPLDKEN